MTFEKAGGNCGAFVSIVARKEAFGLRQLGGVAATRDLLYAVRTFRTFMCRGLLQWRDGEHIGIAGEVVLGKGSEPRKAGLVCSGTLLL